MVEIGSGLDVRELADGEFFERIRDAIRDVLENILDEETSESAERGITIKVKLHPKCGRRILETDLDIQTKLAPKKELRSTLSITYGTMANVLEIRERTKQIRGQMNFFKDRYMPVNVDDVEAQEPSAHNTTEEETARSGRRLIDTETGEILEEE